MMQKKNAEKVTETQSDFNQKFVEIKLDITWKKQFFKTFRIHFLHEFFIIVLTNREFFYDTRLIKSNLKVRKITQKTSKIHIFSPCNSQVTFMLLVLYNCTISKFVAFTVIPILYTCNLILCYSII